LIIGVPDPTTISGATDAYTGANNSITNVPHNRWIIASGASYVSGPLTAANTVPTWVLAKIYFGTTYNTIFTIDNSPEASEPASGALMFSGLLLAGWFGRKRLIRRSESTSGKAV
jgi:hypothetical protein